MAQNFHLLLSIFILSFLYQRQRQAMDHIMTIFTALILTAYSLPLIVLSSFLKVEEQDLFVEGLHKGTHQDES